MNLTRAKSISISHIDFLNLDTGKARNAIAESEIPETLQQAINAGVQILVADPLGQNSWRVKLKSGQFQYTPVVLKTAYPDCGIN